MALAGAALVLGIIGMIPIATAVIIALFAAFMFIATRWSFSRYAKGTAYLDDYGITVVTKAGNQWYPWRDIEDIHLQPLTGSAPMDWLIARSFGSQAKGSAVELKLRRSLRVSPTGGRMGTEVAGIPVFQRKMKIAVADSVQFIETATSLLRASSQSERG